MKTARLTYGWLWSCLLLSSLLLLSACSEDTEMPEEKGTPLKLLSVTRGDSPSSPERVTSGSIIMYITQSNEANPPSGTFSYSKNSWTNTGLSVKENTQYYFYGYMNGLEGVTGSIAVPSTPSGSDYSHGADLTLSGLPIFTDKDIRVIVGVNRVTAADDYSPATEGVFGYASGIASENFLNLLMAHLYVKLKLQFCVDAEYYALRRIHLKEVTLTSTYGATVTATVKLRSGKGLTGQVDYGLSAGASTVTQTLLSSSDPEVNLASAAAETYSALQTINCPHCLFDASGTYLSITSTYDVYDTAGYKIRENCTATNKIKTLNNGPGSEKTLTLTVKPTYLYVLSDPDLDNPTVTIE